MPTEKEYAMPSHVLIVEDSPSQALRLKLELLRYGLEVEVATSGDAGLSSVRTCLPSVIVLDVDLPGIDGISLCRQLKQDLATADIPIIMLTHRDHASDTRTGLEVGADDYIPKDAYAEQNVIAALRHFAIL